MAIKLDEARIRLLNISGGVTPTTNNSLNLGSSNYKWANVYATTFQGNATSASTLTSITTSDAASSSDVWRRIWMGWANNTTGRPAYDDRFAIQTSTGTLKAPIFSGALSGGIKDYNDGTLTKFGYSTSGMAQSAVTWLGAWDATVSGEYRLRAVKQADLRVAYAASAGSVAWGNITGKPSTYAPSSHNHSYITSKGATVANTRTPAYSESLITGGWASADAGYGSTYGTTLDISGYSTWYHRLAFHTGGQIDYWMGINTTTLTKQGTLITSANYSSYALPLTGGTLSGTLKWSNALTKVTSPTVVAAFIGNDSTNGLGYASTSDLSVGRASLLNIHNTVTSTTTRSTNASSWTGNISGVKYMWGQAFKDTSIGTDTGDIVFAVRAGQYTSGGTELCVCIDGDYYSMGNKVLHAGNYTSYTVTKTGSGASGTWGISISGNAATATSAGRLTSSIAFTPAETALTPANVKALIGAGSQIRKGSWSYAGNGYIASGTTATSACPYGAIDLAGTMVIQSETGSQYTQIYITPPTASTSGAIKGEMLYYIDQGTEYSPTWYRVLTDKNYTAYTDSRYVNVSGDTMTGVLNAHGGITLNSSTAQGTLQYILGIKAFADGGNILWQTASNVTVGKANALTVNAGNAGQPVYFTGGVPTAIDWHIGNSGVGEHNCNNVTYNFSGYYTSNGPATSLGPTTNDGALWAQAYSSSWVAQMAQDYRDGSLYVRGKNSGTWTAWQNVILGNGYQNVGPIKLTPGEGANNITTNYISAGRGYSTGSGLNGLKLVATEQNDAISGLGQDCTGKAYELSIAAAVGTSGQGYITFVGHKMASLSTYSELGHFNFANSTFYVNGKIGVGTTSPSYAIHAVGDVYANGGWLRSSGDTGWYNQSYGGGWYMADSTYIRSYSSKQVLIGNTLYIGTTAGGGTGLSLYGTSAPTLYGIHMSTTANYGKFGDVQSDWATYFNMNAVGQRGWIYRAGSTNVASISANGIGAFKGITTCNRGNSDGLYSNSGLEIREYNYSGSGSDTWGQAPRLSFHWSGKVAAQIGLASNGYLYTAPSTGTSFYKLVYESGTWGINISGNAATATVAATLGKSGGTTGPMKFYWSGQSGQPSWLWGGNDGTNMYVYNPSNFSVNYATSAGSASSATTATTANFLTNCYAYDGNSNYASYPWHKVASVTTTSGYADFTITFLVTKGMEGTSGGILRARLRTNGSALCESAQLYWLQASNLNASDFVGVYTNGSSSCTMEIWVKVTGQWEGKIFTVLSQSNRSNCGSYWTLSNTNGNGAASYTSGTAAFTSSMPVYTSGSGLYGAVWNDYAEYRAAETLEPGRVIRESADGVMKLTTERLLPGCEIISDTFGFALGKTDECKTPIAATGRVLAYPLEDRDSFELGQAVCSGPNGTVSKMTREEIITYPERIIGTVSEIPTYDTWGTDNIAVNGRIWIRIK